METVLESHDSNFSLEWFQPEHLNTKWSGIWGCQQYPYVSRIFGMDEQSYNEGHRWFGNGRESWFAVWDKIIENGIEECTLLFCGSFCVNAYSLWNISSYSIPIWPTSFQTNVYDPSNIKSPIFLLYTHPLEVSLLHNRMRKHRPKTTRDKR